jgi:hypothetical protein
MRPRIRLCYWSLWRLLTLRRFRPLLRHRCFRIDRRRGEQRALHQRAARSRGRYAHDGRGADRHCCHADRARTECARPAREQAADLVHDRILGAGDRQYFEQRGEEQRHEGQHADHQAGVPEHVVDDAERMARIDHMLHEPAHARILRDVEVRPRHLGDVRLVECMPQGGRFRGSILLRFVQPSGAYRGQLGAAPLQRRDVLIARLVDRNADAPVEFPDARPVSTADCGLFCRGLRGVDRLAEERREHRIRIGVALVLPELLRRGYELGVLLPDGPSDVGGEVRLLPRVDQLHLQPVETHDDADRNHRHREHQDLPFHASGELQPQLARNGATKYIRLRQCRHERLLCRGTSN